MHRGVIDQDERRGDNVGRGDGRGRAEVGREGVDAIRTRPRASRDAIDPAQFPIALAALRQLVDALNT